MTSLLTSSLLAVFEKDSTFWLPGPRSKYAHSMQSEAWNPILYVCLFFFAVVVVAMVIFMIKYRRRGHADQVGTVTHNTPIEIVWTLIPLLLVMWFFVVGFKSFVNYDTPPSDAIVIDATGQQWSFQFTYPGGGKSDVLFVPKGKPVRLNMTSTDVLHALYIPNFHIGRNMIPGRTTELWFEATQVSGDAGYPIYCTQYCGKSHSTMFTKVVVMEPADYERKLIEISNVFKKDRDFLPYAEVGEKLYNAQCRSCHSVNGEENTGPTWKGFWKRRHEFEGNAAPVEPVADPAAGYADEAHKKMIDYIAESILVPGAKIVKGRSNSMNSFANDFGDDASATPEKDFQAYYKYQKTLAVAEYMKKLSYDEKYDPTKAPTFREPGGSVPATAPAAPATATQPANGK